MRRFSLILLTLSALHSTTVLARDEQPCDETLMQEALQERLGVDLQPQTQGNVIAWACKTHPENSRLMAAAIFYHLPPGSSPDIGFVLALIDTRTRTVKSSYQETLEEDAGTRIGSNSLLLDMGRYR